MVLSRTLASLRCLGLALGLLASGCGDEVTPPPTLPEGEPFKLSELTWNGRKLDLGRITAVAEIYDDTLVLSDQGAQVLTSGVPLANDPGQKGWRAAAVVPAGDLSGSWAMAVDKDGAIRRLRNRSVMEDVSDRYGLAGTPVNDLAALGESGVAFALADKVAVADGQTVTRYDGALQLLAGTAGRVAGAISGGLRVLELGDKISRDYALGAVSGVVFDEGGKLVVATGDAVYREGERGALNRVHQSSEPLTALARSGGDLWLQMGGSLAMIRDGKLRRAQAGDALSQVSGAVKLVPSVGGGLWVLKDGALRHLAEDNGGGADEDLWRNNCLPLFTRLCATCHLPGGSSGIDLSTYRSWLPRRGLMNIRVIQGKPTPMPPAGAGELTADEKTALTAWISNTPQSP